MKRTSLSTSTGASVCSYLTKACKKHFCSYWQGANERCNGKHSRYSSEEGQHATDQYTQDLQWFEDLSPRSHWQLFSSDLRQFLAWCEARGPRGFEDASPFTTEKVAPPTLIWYRTSLVETIVRA